MFEPHVVGNAAYLLQERIATGALIFVVFLVAAICFAGGRRE